MLFIASFRVFLWSLVTFVVIAVVAYLATDLGLVDWVYGPGPQAWLNDKKALLQSTFEVKGESIDRGVKIIGLAFTVVLGLEYFRKWLHYLKSNLPLRLQEYADRIKEAHLQDRVILFAPYASRNLRGDQTLAMPAGVFDRFLTLFRTDPCVKSVRRLMEDASTHDGDIKVLSAKLGMRKSQRITAHLIEGLRLAAEAKLLEPGSAALLTKNEAALAEFRKALKLDENDLDALEQAAKQTKLLNLYVPMQTYLTDMVRVAQDQKRPIRYARALRFQAEVLEERSTRVRIALRDARTTLETALKALFAEGVKDNGEEKTLELALVNEQLGSLHLRRGTTKLAKDNLDDAEEFYKALSAAEGPAGLLRIEKLRARLAKAGQGGDEPDEPEDAYDGAILATPTHVTIEELNVVEAPKGNSRVVEKLLSFTAITLVRKEQGWALVAKRGDPIGYVPATKLRDLHFE